MSHYFIGLMSGTSMDGVDAVLASFEQGPRSHGHTSVAFSEQFKEELLALNLTGNDELHRASLASINLVSYYHQAIEQLLNETGVSVKEVRAIGAHGQTVRHRPDLGYTLQINNPALLAEKTDIAVIADFRSRDIAAGGQGAPLVPAFHEYLFGSQQKTAILNLGGIANLSILEAKQPTLGFDTGPANLFLDMWCQTHTGQAYDKDGMFAAQGRANPSLVNYLIASEPWFSLAPPKSTGRDLFTPEWLQSRLASWQQQNSTEILSAADIQASLVELTAQTVLNALSSTPSLHHLYVCGGGAYNPLLMKALQKGLQCPVSKTDEMGVPAQQMEALAFAWLAYAHIHHQPANLPEVTGAKGPRILGAYYPA